MLFDIKEAAISVTKEKDFREKLFIGTFLVMLANFLSTFSFRHNSNISGAAGSASQNPLVSLNLIAGFAVLFVVLCYLLAFLHNKINNREMPRWSEVYNYFVKGFKLVLSNILLGIPAFMFNGLLIYVYFYMISVNPAAGNSPLGGVIRALVLLGWFVFVFFSILQTAVFAKRLKFRDFFNLVKGYYSLAGNFVTFLVFALVVFALMTFWVWISVAAKTAGPFSYLLILLISSPVFYIMTIYVDLLSQWAKKSYSMDEVE